MNTYISTLQQPKACRRAAANRIGLIRLIHLLVFLLIPLAPLAQETWIGKPTIGDYVRRDIAEFARSVREAREAGKVKAEFNEEIGQARRAFFATAGTPDKRGPAEKKFADLLRQKDNHNLLMSLVSGEPSGAGGFTGAFDALSGGPIDGGIPAAALPAFNRWVDAMRKSLGNLSTADETRLAKAMLDNSSLYDEYKVFRDKHEFDAHIANRRVAAKVEEYRKAQKAGKSSDGSMKLSKQGVVAFSARLHSGRKPGRPPNPKFETWAKQVESGGQQILRCEYGPQRFEGGEPVYDVYWLWRKSAPVNLYDALQDGQLLGNLSANFAPADCPATYSEARNVIESAYRTASSDRARVQQELFAKQRTDRDESRVREQAERDQRSRANAERASATRAAANERQKVARTKYCDALDANLDRLRKQMDAAPSSAKLIYLQKAEANVAARCER